MLSFTIKRKTISYEKSEVKFNVLAYYSMTHVHPHRKNKIRLGFSKKQMSFLIQTKS